MISSPVSFYIGSTIARTHENFRKAVPNLSEMNSYHNTLSPTVPLFFTLLYKYVCACTHIWVKRNKIFPPNLRNGIHR